jgi:hypothetical protein
MPSSAMEKQILLKNMTNRFQDRLFVSLFAASTIVPAFAFLAASIVMPAYASGSYSTTRPPKAKAEAGMAMKLDQEKYGLGQKIYDGKVELMAHSDAQMQKERLKMIQASVPADVAMKKDIVGLAGRLSPQQLDALEYYVTHRFPMKK